MLNYMQAHASHYVRFTEHVPLTPWSCSRAPYHAPHGILVYSRVLLAAMRAGRRAWTFTDLLHHVHDAPGIRRIRFATSHPRRDIAQTSCNHLISVYKALGLGIDLMKLCSELAVCCMCRYFTERLIRACAELPKMCEFFHIPFQSGDNDILRQMKYGASLLACNVFHKHIVFRLVCSMHP